MLSTAGVHDILLTAFAVLIIIILGGSVYALFAAIFKFIFAGGDSDKVKGAYNSIRYMVIGLLFTALVLFLFPIIFRWINIPNYELFTASNIFHRVGEIFQYIFQIGGMARDSSGLFDSPGFDSSVNGGVGDYTL